MKLVDLGRFSLKDGAMPTVNYISMMIKDALIKTRDFTSHYKYSYLRLRLKLINFIDNSHQWIWKLKVEWVSEL